MDAGCREDERLDHPHLLARHTTVRFRSPFSYGEIYIMDPGTPMQPLIDALPPPLFFGPPAPTTQASVSASTSASSISPERGSPLTNDTVCTGEGCVHCPPIETEKVEKRREVNPLSLSKTSPSSLQIESGNQILSR